MRYGPTEHKAIALILIGIGALIAMLCSGCVTIDQRHVPDPTDNKPSKIYCDLDVGVAFESALEAPPAPENLSGMDITFAWNHSDTNQLGGFQLYYGPASGEYTNVVDVGFPLYDIVDGLAEFRWTLIGLPTDCTNYVAATAYNVLGMESDYSEELVLLFEPPPPPTNATLTTLFSNQPTGPWFPILTNVVPVLSGSGFFMLQITPGP